MPSAVDPITLRRIVRQQRCGLDASGPCGGIGRRARLKIEFRKECWFDPGQGHHLPYSPLPMTAHFSKKIKILSAGGYSPLPTATRHYAGIYGYNYV